MTLRSDLGRLASQGHLIRSYGGALLAEDAGQDVPVSVKQTIRQADKVRIAQAAAQLVETKQTIILDSGSTIAELAKALKRRNIGPFTVITHALNVAQEFVSAPEVSVIMIGGLMRHTSESFVGPQAERMQRECGAQHCFLGIDGLTTELELATPDVLEAQLNTAMMQIAEQTTVLADGSGFNHENDSSRMARKQHTAHATPKRNTANPIWQGYFAHSRKAYLLSLPISIAS